VTAMNRLVLTLVSSMPCLVEAATATVAPPTDVGVGDLLRVVASLGVVIALIFAAGWLLRRLPGNARSGHRLRFVESVSVGVKERIVLVQAGDIQLLLGVGAGNVRTLHIFNQPIVVSNAYAEPSATAFRSLIPQWRSKAS
jgi:flagellar protein FliO/FliZ